MKAERKDLARRMRYGLDDGLDPLDAPPLHTVSPVPNYVQFTKIDGDVDENVDSQPSHTSKSLRPDDTQNVSSLIARFGKDRSSRAPSPALTYRPPPNTTRTGTAPNSSRVSSLIARFEVTAREIIDEDDKQFSTVDFHQVKTNDFPRSDTRVNRTRAVYNNRKTASEDIDQNLALAKESKIRSLLFCGAIPLPHIQSQQQSDDQASVNSEELPLVEKNHTRFFACGGADDTISYKEIKGHEAEDDINTNSTQMSSLPKVEGTDYTVPLLKSPTRSPWSLRVIKHPDDVTVMDMNELSPISRETLRDFEASPPLHPDDHMSSSDVSPSKKDGTSTKLSKLTLQQQNHGKAIDKAKSFDSLGLVNELFLDDTSDANHMGQGNFHEGEAALLRESKTRISRDRYASPTDQHFIEMDKNNVILDHKLDKARGVSDSCLSPNGPIFVEFGSEGLELAINEQQAPENLADRCISPSIQIHREEPASPLMISSPTSTQRLIVENAEMDWDSMQHHVFSSRKGKLRRNIPVNTTTSESTLLAADCNITAAKVLGEKPGEMDLKEALPLPKSMIRPPPDMQNVSSKITRQRMPASSADVSKGEHLSAKGEHSTNETKTRHKVKLRRHTVSEQKLFSNDSVAESLAQEIVEIALNELFPVAQAGFESSEKTDTQLDELLALQAKIKKKNSLSSDFVSSHTTLFEDDRQKKRRGKSQIGQANIPLFETTSTSPGVRRATPTKSSERKKDVAPTRRKDQAKNETRSFSGVAASSMDNTRSASIPNSKHKSHHVDQTTTARASFADFMPGVESDQSIAVSTFVLRKDVALRPQLKIVLDEIRRRRAERKIPTAQQEPNDQLGIPTSEPNDTLESKDRLVVPEKDTKNNQKPKTFVAAFDEYDRLLDQLLRQNKILKQGGNASTTSLGDDSGIVKDRVTWIRRERDQAIDKYDSLLEVSDNQNGQDVHGTEVPKNLADIKSGRGIALQMTTSTPPRGSCTQDPRRTNVEVNSVVPSAAVQLKHESHHDKNVIVGQVDQKNAGPVSRGIENCRDSPPDLCNDLRSESIPLCKSNIDNDTSGSIDELSEEKQTWFGSPTVRKVYTHRQLNAQVSKTGQNPITMHLTMPPLSPQSTTLPFLAKVEEEMDRPPRIVSIEVREPSSKQASSAWDEIWDHDRPDTPETIAPPKRQQATSPHCSTEVRISSPEKERLLGSQTSHVTRKLRRQLDLARLATLAIRNSNQSLSLELQAFKHKLWQHRTCKRGERNILEACHYQLGSFQRRLKENRQIHHGAHWPNMDSSPVSTWDEFSDLQGAMLANLELMQYGRESLMGNLRQGVREGRVDEDTERLREVVRMMERL